MKENSLMERWMEKGPNIGQMMIGMKGSFKMIYNMVLEYFIRLKIIRRLQRSGKKESARHLRWGLEWCPMELRKAGSDDRSLKFDGLFN